MNTTRRRASLKNNHLTSWCTNYLYMSVIYSSCSGFSLYFYINICTLYFQKHILLVPEICSIPAMKYWCEELLPSLSVSCDKNSSILRTFPPLTNRPFFLDHREVCPARELSVDFCLFPVVIPEVQSDLNSLKKQNTGWSMAQSYMHKPDSWWHFWTLYNGCTFL